MAESALISWMEPGAKAATDGLAERGVGFGLGTTSHGPAEVADVPKPSRWQQSAVCLQPRRIHHLALGILLPFIKWYLSWDYLSEKFYGHALSPHIDRCTP